jgi:hypothetical protein
MPGGIRGKIISDESDKNADESGKFSIPEIGRFCALDYRGKSSIYAQQHL